MLNRAHGLSTWLLLTVATVATAADQAAEKAAIQKAIESYTKAFNDRDAKTMAGRWAPDAAYVNPLTGQQVLGRDKIKKEFESLLNSLDKKAKLVVDVQSIEFISPSVAVEHGMANLVVPGKDAQKSSYTAVHVKQNGEWLLDRVTEEEIPVVISHYEKLKEIEWMIGSWVDDSGGDRVVTHCQWTRNKNFMTRSFTVSLDGRIDLTGLEIVGWDPARKQIRSWVFDSDGGFAEGRWTKKDKSWYVTTKGTLPDGKTATSVKVTTMVDNDRFQLQSIHRTVDGQLLPNIKAVEVVRMAKDK